MTARRVCRDQVFVHIETVLVAVMVQSGSHFFDQNPRDRISVLLTPWTIRLNFASRCRIYALSRLNRQKRTGRKEDRCCFFHS